MRGLHDTLYNRAGGVLRYYEAWAEPNTLFEYQGIVGERGELRETQMLEGTSAERAIADVEQPAREQGFAAIDINAHARLLIEHKVGRPCTEEDADERLTLEYRIGDLLHWTGLGGTSGGEVWPDAFEVFCFVVDFEIAKRVISADLCSTKYAHARIYEEDFAVFGPVPAKLPKLKR